MQRLKSFVGPKPLVVGKYGDLNSGLRQLINDFAKAAGAAKWKEHNYKSEEIATARMKVHFSRVLGLAAHKSQARLLLDRIHALDGPAQRIRSLNRTAEIGTFGTYALMAKRMNKTLRNWMDVLTCRRVLWRGCFWL